METPPQTPLQAALLRMVIKERDRQDKKFGSQRKQPNSVWLAILTEEVGESAQEVLNAYFQNRSSQPDAPLRAVQARDLLIAELVQVTAVGLAWLEALVDQVSDDAQERAVEVPPGLSDAVHALREGQRSAGAIVSTETSPPVDTGAQS